MPQDPQGDCDGGLPDFGALIDNSPVVIAVLNENGSVRFAGRMGVERLMGQPVDGLIGELPEQLVHPDDIERVANAFAECLAVPESTGEVVFRAFASEGETTYRYLAGEFQNRFHDPAIRGMVMHLVDISVAMRTSEELELRLAAEALLASITRDFIDRGPHDLDAVINDALRAIGELTGADRGWVFAAGGDFTIVDNTHEWCRDPADSRIARVQAVSLESIPGMVESMLALRPTLLDIENDPQLHAEARRLFASNTLTAFMVPMVIETIPVGCVGFETFGRRGEWPPAVVSLLEQFASLLINALLRRESEAARERTESLLQGLVTGSPDVFVVVDGEGTLSYVSPAVERMLGYVSDDVLGIAVWEVLHSDDVPNAYEALQRALLTPDGVSEPIEVRIKHLNGRWVVCEVVGHNLVEDGTVSGVVINVRDITERRRIERHLRDAQLRFEEAWKHAPIGMVMMGVDGTVLRANPAFALMVEMRERSLVGLEMRSLVHDDDRAPHRDELMAVIAGERESLQAELRLVRPDRSTLWSRLSMSAVRGDDGQALYLIGQVEDITERRAFEERLAFEASHDALTGLPLRKPVLDHLNRSLAAMARRDEGLALLFIDLDNFKRINDTLGHAAGDELLQAFADRLSSAVRQMDMAARLGGDEFVVVCPALHSALEAVTVAERLMEMLEQPFTVRDLEVFVGASIGIAIADVGTDAATLLRQADTAAYRAKEQGRGRYEVFDDDLRTTVARRLDVETALRRAIERDEVLLHYQPVIDVSTGGIAGFEGLARWERPGHGLVPPAEFLSIAEDTGLIVPIGARVLRIACEQYAAWRGEFGEGAPGISVNLSIRQLMHSGFLEVVRESLAATGVPPDRLTLEITESLLMQDAAASIALLEEIRALGVRLAIDDFGTGYSSLSYLRRLPVDTIKIDRSFVLELGLDHDGSTIVAAVINLAHALGMDIIAEGVEHIEHVAALVALGCDRMQGFYFSRPVAPAVATEMLRSDPLETSAVQAEIRSIT